MVWSECSVVGTNESRTHTCSMDDGGDGGGSGGGSSKKCLVRGVDDGGEVGVQVEEEEERTPRQLSEKELRSTT